MSSQGCWLGLPLLLTTVAGGFAGPGSLEITPHRVKRGFTYPGTLWCGAGNNAENYEQLGEYEETDRCCRDHDQCQHVIHPFTVGYGHHNFRWHTISHCDCDTRLKQCLQQVNDAASRAVGQAFFNVIQVPCFEFTYEEQCMERYWYGWCKSYGPMPRAVLHDPVLYEFGEELINILPHTSPPLGRTVTPGFGAATQSWKVQYSPSQPAARDGKDVKKRKKNKEKRKKKGLSLTSVPCPVPQLVKELENKTSAPVVKGAAALDWGSKDDGFNDVLHDDPKVEEPTEPTPRKTEVNATAQPKKGRRKGHGRKKGPRKGAVPSSRRSLG
ncbi:protein PROCA1 [Trichosurus vulpecula]|uniref:protein PROCA1 n=1 Tax=Trichosurus vulpecula TaxID=9337 RepID=UPI00186B26B1|nr:protein PROCA1 [Trichosurus vulpecula]